MQNLLWAFSLKKTYYMAKDVRHI